MRQYLDGSRLAGMGDADYSGPAEELERRFEVACRQIRGRSLS